MASTAVLTAMGVDNEEFIVSAVFMRCENDQLSGWSPSSCALLLEPFATDPIHTTAVAGNARSTCLGSYLGGGDETVHTRKHDVER